MIKKNIYSILVALLLLYLSLTNSEKFQKTPLVNIPFMDKIVHFGMYFVMMSVIILEHRKSLKNSRQSLFICFDSPVIRYSHGNTSIDTYGDQDR